MEESIKKSIQVLLEQSLAAANGAATLISANSDTYQMNNAAAVASAAAYDLQCALELIIKYAHEEDDL